MRRILTIGLPSLAVLVAAGGWGWVALRGNPLIEARKHMARGDMTGAELYLREAVRQHPLNGEAAFLLGTVEVALSKGAAGELELRRAAACGFDPAAIVQPMSQAYLQQRHYQQVLRDFDPATAPKGALASVLTARASAQLALRDIDAASASAAAAEAAAPDTNETLMIGARVALARGDLDGVTGRTAKILAKDPKQPDALLLTSEIAMRRDDPQGALRGAEEVLAANPGRLDARTARARALAALGRAPEARADADIVLKSSPRDVSANYLRAMLALRAHDYAAADVSLTAIASLIGELPRGNYFVAVTKLGLGQPQQAEEAAHKFLSQKPGDVAGLKLLAFVELARHRPDEALKVLQTGPLATNPDAETLDLLGRAQTMAGDPAKASENFDKAVALSPNDVNVINRLAASRLSLGDTAGAEADLRKSVTIAPKQALAGQALVQADLARGDIPEATAELDRLKQAGGDNEATGVLAAQIRIAALDLDGAEAKLKDVVGKYPNSRAASLNLVRIYALRGDQTHAEETLESLLRKNPGDEGVLDVLLPALLTEQQIPRAIRAAEAAHAAAPDSVGITAALAGAYVRGKQYDRAAALLDRAGAGGNAQLDTLRARVLAAGGKTAAAEQQYKEILQQTPGDVHACADLAGLQAAGHDYDGARATLQAGLAESPGQAALLGALVSVELKDKGINAALATAATLQKDPKNMPAAASLAGDAWLATGDVHQASLAYAASYKARPSSQLAIKTATSMAGDGRADQGETLLAGWTAANGTDLAAQSTLASLYINNHKLDEAESRLRAILALRQTDTAALNNLAWIRQQQGDMPEALTLAKRAYFQSPVPSVADTLGWILANDGATDSALPLFGTSCLGCGWQPHRNRKLPLRLRAERRREA